MLARKVAARLIGIHDGRRLRKHVARQMVVGDDDLHAESVGLGHAIHAGDAVIDGDEDVRLALAG